MRTTLTDEQFKKIKKMTISMKTDKKTGKKDD